LKSRKPENLKSLNAPLVGRKAPEEKRPLLGNPFTRKQAGAPKAKRPLLGNHLARKEPGRST
jgi:hypothetical protein